MEPRSQSGTRGSLRVAAGRRPPGPPAEPRRVEVEVEVAAGHPFKAHADLDLGSWVLDLGSWVCAVPVRAAGGELGSCRGLPGADCCVPHAAASARAWGRRVTSFLSVQSSLGTFGTEGRTRGLASMWHRWGLGGGGGGQHPPPQANGRDEGAGAVAARVTAIAGHDGGREVCWGRLM